MRVEIDETNSGQRLDVVVAEVTGLSRTRAGELVGAGSVTVDGRTERKSYRPTAGEAVVVEEPDTPSFDPPRGVEIVYEDAELLVVNKPAGVVVHRAPGLEEGTLTDALEQQGVELAGGDPDRPGVVHRLDRDVSGLLVLAKTESAYRSLVADMAARRIERRYLALVAGDPGVDRGKIDAPIGRHPRHRTRMAVLPEGRPAVTWFGVRERLGQVALLEVTLETGRTHQIRTHLASIGHPVVGDAAYGHDPRLARELGLARPFLHAWELAFTHPGSGEPIENTRDLPPELVGALDRARTQA